MATVSGGVTGGQGLLDPAAAEAVAADAAPTAEEANAVLKTWRIARRAAHAAVRRITGHSFRRGWIQQALAAGNPPETVAIHSRQLTAQHRLRRLPPSEGPLEGEPNPLPGLDHLTQGPVLPKLRRQT